MAYIAAGAPTGWSSATPFAWDVAAGIVLVEAAGGQVTGFEGEPVIVEGRGRRRQQRPAPRRSWPSAAGADAAGRGRHDDGVSGPSGATTAAQSQAAPSHHGDDPAPDPDLSGSAGQARPGRLARLRLTTATIRTPRPAQQVGRATRRGVWRKGPVAVGLGTR
jgi:hypothetical protein